MRPYHLAPIVFAAAATVPVTHAANWYEEMQLGPAWANSFAGTFDGQEQVAAVKGVLVDLGDGTRALFDTETLRVVTVYKGGVHWGGTPWTGSHGQLVKTANEKDFIFNTVPGPGWADDAGSFADKRTSMDFTLYTAKRDASKVTAACGNIPGAQYKGFYRHGSRIVFEYTVNGTHVLEHLQSGPDGFVRHFEVAAHSKPLSLLAADDSSAFTADKSGAKSGSGLSVATGGRGDVLSPEADNATSLIATLAPS